MFCAYYEENNKWVYENWKRSWDRYKQSSWLYQYVHNYVSSLSNN